MIDVYNPDPYSFWLLAVFLTATTALVSIFLFRGCRQPLIWLTLLFTHRLVMFLFWVLWALPFYQGMADSIGYHSRGVAIVEGLSTAEFRIGTTTIDLVTAGVYSIFGPTIEGMYLLSACLSIVSTIIFYRALEVDNQSTAARRLGLLALFFYPSLGMWSSIYGKDGFIYFGMSLVAWSLVGQGFAAARISALLTGLLVLSLIRPHVALVLIVALISAYILLPIISGKISWVHGFARVAVLSAALVGLMPMTLAYVDIRELSVESVLERNNAAAMSNSVGGSVIEGRSLSNPLDLVLSMPMGAVNLLIRPFPWEANNMNAMLAAMENCLALLALLFLRVRWRHALGAIRSNLLCCFGAIFITLLISAYSIQPNLGLLFRVRMQILPWIIAILVASCRPMETRQWKNYPSQVQPHAS